MRNQPNQVGGESSPHVEHLIVLQVLDGQQTRTRADLTAVLSDIDPEAVADSLASLEAEQVVVLEGQRVRASRCAVRLDALDLICV
jgi:hypothetical protein